MTKYDVVTIVDIAERIGVSCATVSRALNGKKGVGERKRKMIIELANDLCYEPNAIAQGLREKAFKTIGLVIPDIANPLYPAIARGVEDKALEYGYNVFLCNSNWSVEIEQTQIKSLKQLRVAGLILNPTSDIFEDNYKDTNIPSAYISSRLDERYKPYVGVDNVQAGFIATEYLIKCGYTRIGFIGGTAKSYDSETRYEGYLKALKHYGLNCDESLCEFGWYSLRSGKNIMTKLLELDNPCDAVFCANDTIAIGALSAANSMNISVPDELGIMGFDNISMAEIPQLELSTISIPKYEMGVAAVELLMQVIQGTEGEEHKVLEPELIIRKTTKKLFGG